MTERKASFSTTCPQCGHELPAMAETCPGCGKATPSAETPSDPWSLWSQAGKTKKIQWVAAVMGFWVSTVVLIIVFFLENKLNLILVSVVLGMMLLGVWLKTRYQMHLRKEPERPTQNVRAD